MYSILGNGEDGGFWPLLQSIDHALQVWCPRWTEQPSVLQLLKKLVRWGPVWNVVEHRVVFCIGTPVLLCQEHGDAGTRKTSILEYAVHLYSPIVHGVYGLLLALVSTEDEKWTYCQLTDGLENMADDTAGYHGDLVDKDDVTVGKFPVNGRPFSTADGNVECAVYSVGYDLTPEQSSVPACQKAGQGGNHDRQIMHKTVVYARQQNLGLASSRLALDDEQPGSVNWGVMDITRRCFIRILVLIAELHFVASLFT